MVRDFSLVISVIFSYYSMYSIVYNIVITVHRKHTFKIFKLPRCMLRKIFVKKLVPYDMAEIDRMKMYLYLWINTDSEDRSILHELFLRTKELVLF